MKTTAICLIALALLAGLALAAPDSLDCQMMDWMDAPRTRLLIVFENKIAYPFFDSTNTIAEHIFKQTKIQPISANPLLSPQSKHKNPKLIERLNLDKIATLDFLETENQEQIIKKIEAIKGIKSCQIDGMGAGTAVPTDPEFPSQWGFNSTGYNPSPFNAIFNNDIDAVEAWDISAGSSDIVVAVIDGGFDWMNSDLNGRQWINTCDSLDGIDNDSNGYIDDYRGWDFAYGDNDPMDDFGHGTNVAGIIGAEANNSYGTAGLDWNCRLMNLKALNSSNWGYYSWWAEAIIYACDNGANIINLSLAGEDLPGTALPASIQYAESLGVLLVAAMGNYNSDIIMYPASFTGVMAVGAIDKTGRRCNPFCWGGGSNYNTYISVCAPGDYIRSTLWSLETYAFYCGTSQATPMVSGLASLIMGMSPSLSPIEVKAIICSTATDLVGIPTEDTPGWDIYHGWGRINAYQALCLTDIRPDSEMSPIKPIEIILSSFPNPFNSAVTIAIDIPIGDGSPVPISVEIYDVNGRRVKTVTEPVEMTAGFAVSSDINAKHPSTSSGSVFSPLTKGRQGGSYIWRPDESLPSGVYLVRARFDHVGLVSRLSDQSGCETSRRVVYLK